MHERCEVTSEPASYQCRYERGHRGRHSFNACDTCHKFHEPVCDDEFAASMVAEKLNRPAGMDIARVERMHSEAITIFELTKGFTSKPNRAGQAMLDMAGYVLELTALLLDREKGQR